MLGGDLLHVIFESCCSITKVRFASVCKDVYTTFRDELHAVNKSRNALIFLVQTRARIMAYDRGCHTNLGGQSSKQVWKAVMRTMGINPRFCTTEHECIARITSILQKKTPDELEEMIIKFRTFNMIFHEILLEAAAITQDESLSRLAASHAPHASGSQRTDMVMAFVDICINSPQQMIIGTESIRTLIKASMDVTNNPMIYLQYMRLPDEDIRYWSDVALKDVANA